MSYFNIVAQSSESTVVTEYKPQAKRSEAYQSEADLEKEFIRLLCELGYERLTIHKEADLIANLRTQLEKLNNYRFTGGEWKRFWDEVLANTNSGILEKTRLIQEDYVQVLRRDNGESKNIQLIDKKCIHNNSLQVINQYAISAEEGAAHNNRYDVTVLVNGLPLIHIELKRRGVPIREAFNQIDRYQRDSFWASSGLYEFVQIFVISNGTNTKYYSNTASAEHGNPYAVRLLHSIRSNRNQYACMAAIRLLHHISRMIKNRLDDERKIGGAVADRKLMRKIEEKKQAQGIKMG